MRKSSFFFAFFLLTGLYAVRITLPDISLEKNWKSRSFTTSGGETVKVNFTAEGKGKAAGILITNGSSSTFCKFTVLPGKNSHTLTFPVSKHPIRLFMIDLRPQNGTKFLLKNFIVNYILNNRNRETDGLSVVN